MFPGGPLAASSPPQYHRGCDGPSRLAPTTIEGQLHGGRALRLRPTAIGQRFSRSATRLVRSPQWEGPLV